MSKKLIVNRTGRVKVKMIKTCVRIQIFGVIIFKYFPGSNIAMKKNVISTKSSIVCFVVMERVDALVCCLFVV